MPSLYGEYIFEREGKEIIEDKKGFATYSFVEGGVYVQEIYVKPEFRQAGIAASYADIIAEIAKAKGYTRMFGSVCPSAKGSTESLKVLLGYGFKLESAQVNFIWFSKTL